MSEKRSARQGERDRAVEAALARERWVCVAARFVPELKCRGQLDAHEIIPRSAWPEGIYEPDNIVPVCRAHHDWIGSHEVEAHGFGLHGYSWERNSG